jgi:fructose-bisphosphate aldolase class II
MRLNIWFDAARKQGFAIGHFNVSDLCGLKAIVAAAKKLEAPVIVGASEGEAEFFGTRQIAAAVRTFREETGLPIFLNADHTKSFEKIKEAVDAGFDSVHFDGSELPYEDNIRETRRAVEYGKSKNINISVEGELGYLRGSSKIQETVEIKPEDMTNPEQVEEFVFRTGVDRLAPVFGNIHGIVLNREVRLDIERLRAISAKTSAFLVLHGGSGLSENDIREAIRAGITKAHINTELRAAYRRGLEEALAQMPTETTPYKYLPLAIAAMQKVAEEKIRLFGSAGRVKI